MGSSTECKDNKLVSSEVSKASESPVTNVNNFETTSTRGHSPAIINREKFMEGKAKFDQRDFSGAIMDFTSSIDQDNSNNCNKNTYLTYGYRSRAYFEKRLYPQALQDAIMSRKLNPQWTEAYFRQGMSLFHMHRHADCLAALAFGLAQDAKDEHMLQSLVQTALKSEFGKSLEPIYKILVSMDLHTKPFIVASIIGQELLQFGAFGPAVIVLESALKINTAMLKLRGAVYAALGSAYWALKNYDKTIFYMRKDLDIEIELKDLPGQCRAYSNIGYAFYMKRKFCESLDAHRNQLDLAIKIGASHQVVTAFSALGHVHVALNDLSSALVSHSRCLQILKQMQQKEPVNDQLRREYACLGHIYTLKGEYDKAKKCHDEHIRLTNNSHHDLNGDHVDIQVSLIMYNSNMGFFMIKKKNYDDAIKWYEQVITLSQRLDGATIARKDIKRTGESYEMRACGALGHIYRLKKDFVRAREWFEKQNKIFSDRCDIVARSQALSNLAMIHQQERQFDKAHELFSENLDFVKSDPYLTAYALSHMGGIHLSRKQYKESVQYYRQSIDAFKELACSSEITSALNRNLNLAMTAAEENSQSSSKTPSTHQSE